MADFSPGQRWTSDTEPELGLGVVLQAEGRRVQIFFPAGGEVRDYARDGAPLSRVRFRPGDRVWGQDQTPMVVEEVGDEGDRLIYRGEGRALPEAELDDRLRISRPEDRLALGRPDESHLFDLRGDALETRCECRRSPVRGLAGGRIDLIPHQLYIAGEVADRWAPRVLLADEVGLGKTIEAGLIVHRLLATGRAQRVLILVPDPLIHQWFVELLRRFNLSFQIFDEERCESIERADPDANPFLEGQWILCGLDLLAESPDRSRQASDAGWDLVVADEAHHLEWSPEDPSPAYRAVEQVAARTDGLMLLTATPEQLGVESHFARLRLLDPDRYPDFETFREDAARFRSVADLAGQLDTETPPSDALGRALLEVLSEDREASEALVEQARRGDRRARRRLLRELLDLHGPGRVVFRNTRASVEGFPARQPLLVPLTSPNQDGLSRLAREAEADWDDAVGAVPPDLAHDPRVAWLSGFLKKHPDRKVLVIGHRRETIERLNEVLRFTYGSKLSVFHEAMTLIERDRQAAWFADPEGAPVLLCSEIGGEGRNFQFAHDLVLFDLPLDPDRLEQRIGRLDRIGQTETIRIHVPYVLGSPHEVVTLWYHQGLSALNTCLHGGHIYFERLGHRVRALARSWPVQAGTPEGDEALQTLLDDSRREVRTLEEQLHDGRDRLLELSSCRPEAAAARVEGIRRLDRDTRLDAFMLRVFDRYGIEVEEMTSRTYLLRPGPLVTDAFPAIPADGLTVTADREHAATRDDMGFLSWDHPMVTGALDRLLGSTDGNCAFAVRNQPGPPTWCLETWFVLEPVAPARLHADRFLPPTPIRVVVDEDGNDRTEEMPRTRLREELVDASRSPRLQDPMLAGELAPRLLEDAWALAHRRAPAIAAAALRDMQTQLAEEHHRLLALRRRHGMVRDDEIRMVHDQQLALTTAIADAPLRLDALRLIRNEMR